MLYGQFEKVQLEDGSEVDGIRVTLKTKKSAVLRCPTAKEQEAFYTAVALRNQSAIKDEDESNLQAEVDLFNTIRLDTKGEAWDEFEAGYIVGRFIAAEVLAATESGDEHIVTLKTQYGVQTHYLREPTIKEMTVYERAVNKTRTKNVFQPIHKLYNEIMLRTEGYPNTFTDDDIPADHKQLCVSSVRAALLKYDPFETKSPNA
jgi:hypothetical protein